MTKRFMSTGVLALIGFAAAATANAQSFRVQCPTTTITHTTASSTEPAYTSATAINGAIKCQQISGGDGYATMGDGTPPAGGPEGAGDGIAAPGSGEHARR